LIPPILLFIDMFEKERRLDTRQQLFNSYVDHIQWYHYMNEQRYDTPAEWRDYPAMCSAQLNKAFREGRSSVKITMAEKSYIINFVEMTQRQISSGDAPAPTQNVPIYAKAKLTSSFQLEKLNESERVLNAADDQHRRLVSVAMKLLQSGQTPLPSQLSYSLLSLLLRLLSLKGTIEEFIKVTLGQ